MATATAAAPSAVRQGQADILLESGTNELEVLVFGLGQNVFGVNVAKVREVILPLVAAASPGQPDCVLGMFNLRGGVLALVDLHKYLNIQPIDTNPKNRRIIVTEFNGLRAAFQVDRVEQIYRMSWTNMKPVPETNPNESFAITGITEIDGRLVLMLDFESILDHINMQDQLHIGEVENALGVDRGAVRVLVAEDSKFIHSIMKSVLERSGYRHTDGFYNGVQAWKAIEEATQAGQPYDVIITDIEMPQMDGLALTRRVKESTERRQTPVLMFSSLITADTLHKGQQVGADEQIAKPQLPELVSIVDRWVAKLQQKAA